MLAAGRTHGARAGLRRCGDGGHGGGSGESWSAARIAALDSFLDLPGTKEGRNPERRFSAHSRLNPRAYYIHMTRPSRATGHLELTGDNLTLADADDVLHGRVERLSLAP